ncbi:hypothetical protein ABEB36_008252 [Hypothenemus hampei]|uniref:THAP-type domain-containing protein n=1 Tax=Hypothenemus hampei TaxID=57062 RepID=A0ABD1EL85_HYPHA
MPVCYVPNWKNSMAKGFKLYSLPIDERNARRKVWLESLGGENISQNAKICKVHFSQSQFENERLDRR